MDYKVCREDPWGRPALHLGPLQVHSQETDRYHRCRPLTPQTQTVQTASLWQALHSTVRQNHQIQKQFVLHSPTVNLMNICILAHCCTIVRHSMFECIFIYVLIIIEIFFASLHVTKTLESNSQYVYTYLAIKSDADSDMFHMIWAVFYCVLKSKKKKNVMSSKMYFQNFKS